MDSLFFFNCVYMMQANAPFYVKRVFKYGIKLLVAASLQILYLWVNII